MDAQHRIMATCRCGHDFLDNHEYRNGAFCCNKCGCCDYGRWWSHFVITDSAGYVWGMN